VDRDPALSSGPRSWRAAIQAYLSVRVLVQVPMGFASGLPLLLSGQTLKTWMTNLGVNLATVGFFTWTQLPYNFKFLWAPLIDRWQMPFLGRRRGWLLVMQIVIAVVIAALGRVDPLHNLSVLAALAVALSVFSATQDVLVDVYRVDTLRGEERAAGSAMYVLGYRLGMLLAGTFALILSSVVSWSTVYWIMAATMGLAIATTLLAPEPETTRPPRTLSEAVIEPFLDILTRHRALVILAFALLYRFGHAILIDISQVFLVKLGFANAEIGAINKGLGVAMTILGGLVAGGLVARMGTRRSLVVFGVIAAVIHLSYAWLALAGRVHWIFVFTIAVDHFCTGLAVAPFDAYLMALCNRKYSATQFALLTSSTTLLARVVGGWSGVMAERLGWPLFFVATLVMAVPGLVLQLWLPPPEARPVVPDAPDQTSTDKPSAARAAR
jgi:MFS transporter, PAT family, beta-lactamase induction signal transducer AmpG